MGATKSVSDPLRVREIARFVAELLAVIVMQMDRV